MANKTLPTLNPSAVVETTTIFLGRRSGQVEDESFSGTLLQGFFWTNPALTGGTMNNTVIGGTTPAAGSFTTLTANTIDTGNGAVECYPMNQGVRTTDSPTFAALTLTAALPVAQGGTGATSAANARTNLGLVIGTNVQAQSAALSSIAGLTTAADTMIYTTASNVYATTGLTSAGRALIDDADAAAQRTTLGLAIGTDVQAQNAALSSIAGLTTLADRGIYATASNTYAVFTLTAGGRALGGVAGTANTFPYFSALNTVTLGAITAAGLALIDDASNTAQRTTLGLGTIATQAASAVAITGGTITGITDITVADGGTGASTAAGARTNLGLGTISTQDANNVTISGGAITGIADIAIADGGTGASDATNARANLSLYSIAQVDALVRNAGCLATQSTGTSMPSGTWTVIGFNTEAYDDLNWHDNVTNNSRITVNTAGRYLVSGNFVANNAANGDVSVAIAVNGTRVREINIDSNTPAGGSHGLSITAILLLAASDYVELHGIVASGVTETTDINKTALAVKLV